VFIKNNNFLTSILIASLVIVNEGTPGQPWAGPAREYYDGFIYNTLYVETWI
jgi:hypothetical protein